MSGTSLGNDMGVSVSPTGLWMIPESKCSSQDVIQASRTCSRYPRSGTTSSHRYWQYFAGRHHVSVMSWLDQSVQDLDFSSKEGPRYFIPLVPDFMIRITEAPKAPGMHERGQWYDFGVEVWLQLEQGVVERVLQDPWLRHYRCKWDNRHARWAYGLMPV